MRLTHTSHRAEAVEHEWVNTLPHTVILLVRGSSLTAYHYQLRRVCLQVPEVCHTTEKAQYRSGDCSDLKSDLYEHLPDERSNGHVLFAIFSGCL